MKCSLSSGLQEQRARIALCPLCFVCLQELEALKRKLEDQTPGKADDRLKALLSENEALKGAAQRLQEQLCAAQARQGAWDQLAQRLAHRLHDLRDLQHELATLLSTS
ncbi:hypothetical protein V5799_027565 [Amblyomma americanum]|uniref:Uncharacterized protein n=1 Tax=Amblyomma americanum TaxID=6943 RepID=A0AAQ4DFD5_AMBAM